MFHLEMCEMRDSAGKRPHNRGQMLLLIRISMQEKTMYGRITELYKNTNNWLKSHTLKAYTHMHQASAFCLFSRAGAGVAFQG